MTVAEIWQNLHKTPFYRQCSIPLGYTAGLPILRFSERGAALDLPFLRYQMTGTVDKTLVFPPRYIFTAELPSGRIVTFRDLIWEEAFNSTNFAEPVGLFRHEAVRHMGAHLYRRKRLELLELCDKIVQSVRNGQEPPAKEREALRRLYGIMLEPFLKPFYKLIAPAFADAYL
ncbi:MAG: hypothetical protein K6A35_07080 [bacterium]|nr:hypothetical protein [bacterium]